MKKAIQTNALDRTIRCRLNMRKNLNLFLRLHQLCQYDQLPTDRLNTIFKFCWIIAVLNSNSNNNFSRLKTYQRERKFCSTHCSYSHLRHYKNTAVRHDTYSLESHLNHLNSCPCPFRRQRIVAYRSNWFQTFDKLPNIHVNWNHSDPPSIWHHCWFL